MATRCCPSNPFSLFSLKFFISPEEANLIKALIEVLTKPKHALVKQYQKIFKLDDVEITFTPKALDAISELAMDRGTGARGLRSILEDTLLDIMYEVPSQKEIKKIIVGEETVVNNIPPKMVIEQKEAPTKSKKA